MKTLHLLISGLLLIAFIMPCVAQSDSTEAKPKWDYQIYLTKPAKEIKEIKFDEDCSDIKGTLSGDKQRIIIKDYEQGKKVYVKVLYDDGTTGEFIRSSCFIDPVI